MNDGQNQNAGNADRPKRDYRRHKVRGRKLARFGNRQAEKALNQYLANQKKLFEDRYNQFLEHPMDALPAVGLITLSGDGKEYALPEEPNE